MKHILNTTTTNQNKQSKPNDACARVMNATGEAQWRPFVMSLQLPAGGAQALKGMRASAAGAYAWCADAAGAAAVQAIQDANQRTRGFRGMHAVAGGERLLVVSPAKVDALGIFAEFAEDGAFFASFQEGA
jgi:uncharacterized protein with LGFP repeats